MRRRFVRPYGAAVPTTRLLSMVCALVLLWFLYGRLKDPAMWRLFAPHEPGQPVAGIPEKPATETPPPQDNEVIAPGLNDTDADQWEAIKPLLEMVKDRSRLLPTDMHAYWKLMEWSRSQSFAELRSRGLRDVPITKLFETPDKYRGQLIELRMHVRRVIEDDAADNTLGLLKVYEAWGWTEDSKSYPYVVVFPDLPSDLPVGTDVWGEVVFVGYFLKIMNYKAFDKSRFTPVLIGRVHVANRNVPKPAPPPDPSLLLGVIAIGAIVLIGSAVLLRPQRKRPVITRPLSDTELSSEPVSGDSDGFEFSINSPQEGLGFDYFSITDNPVTANPALEETRVETANAVGGTAIAPEQRSHTNASQVTEGPSS